MNWTIPGTVLQIPQKDAAQIHQMFTTMFLGGDLVLSQVAAITGLEPYAIQNWVKRGFLSPPQKKRYTLRQLCRVLNINMLKSVLPMERICGMLGYINGQLNDESDDAIDDSALYFMFVELAVQARELKDAGEQEDILEGIMSQYREPFPGAGERVRQVLRIMLTAWIAARMRQEAEKMLDTLQYHNEKENENGQQWNVQLEA